MICPRITILLFLNRYQVNFTQKNRLETTEIWYCRRMLRTLSIEYNKLKFLGEKYKGTYTYKQKER